MMLAKSQAKFLTSERFASGSFEDGRERAKKFVARQAKHIVSSVIRCMHRFDGGCDEGIRSRECP